MIKKLIKFLFYFSIILILVISYLSFFGLNTERLNDKIKNKILNINKKVNLELKSVKFLVNPFDLSVDVKTFDPEIFFERHKLKLEYIKTNISLKSFIFNEFSIDNLQMSTKAIKLNDVVLLARHFKNSPELFILNKIIKEGFLVGNINLNFDNNGKIKNDYKINGFIKNGELDILSKYNIKDLNLLFKISSKEYSLENIETEFNKIKLSSPSVKIKKKKDSFLISGKLLSEKKDFDKKLLNILFGDKYKNFNIKNINFSSVNNFILNINKKLKVRNFNLESKIQLNNLDYKNNSLHLNKYLPNFKELIKLKNHEILINYKKNQLDFKGKGEIIIENSSDILNYKIIKKNGAYIFDTSININKNPILIDILNYKKEKNSDSFLKLKGIYKKNNEIKFDLISLEENNNNFLIKDLSLNNDYKISNLDLLNFKFTNINKINNKISLKKNIKNYELNGRLFDATKLIEEMFNDNKNKGLTVLLDNFNTNIVVKIDKFYLDNEHFVNKFRGEIVLKKSEINKLNITSNFNKSKKLTLTINNDGNEKITTLYSDYAKPLVKRYKFIKGFEEGSLDFYSIRKNNLTTAKLKIYDFKLQKLPALTKLLTLASLQGIADLLSGEGIRFNDFEMSYSKQKNLMNIEEIYAIGPAISILMEGYVETDKLISLRGTLVPATTINKAIGSIPLLGNILVGKKVGEGVFGVSFKIKGPPKNLKTTVNPIKTLTPRFITRTLEKIKKN
tara:strand:+ start:1045 stop:3246 length:2202 start_codon:yes stop_codon:yes gene_type:complete